MIITCNNCNKKFEIISSLIPNKGRLLQCNGCNHKWFFKKEVISEPTESINIYKPAEDVKRFNEEVKPEEIERTESIELLDEQIKNDFVIKENIINHVNANQNEDIDPKVNSSKNKKSYNILSLIIVFIISFIALIVVLDTFQGPIGKIAPNIEFLLYNLYESINDIRLFFKDLI